MTKEDFQKLHTYLWENIRNDVEEDLHNYAFGDKEFLYSIYTIKESIVTKMDRRGLLSDFDERDREILDNYLCFCCVLSGAHCDDCPLLWGTEHIDEDEDNNVFCEREESPYLSLLEKLEAFGHDYQYGVKEEHKEEVEEEIQEIVQLCEDIINLDVRDE